MRLRCTSCDLEDVIMDEAYRKRKKYGGDVYCNACGSEMVPLQATKTVPSNLRRSRDQEKRAAKHYGARRQKASGAIPGVKGDLRDPGRLRGECKFTRAASYTLKLEELRKLELEANYAELPVFEIEFQNNPPFKRYVVLPQWAFDQLYAARRTANDGKGT